MFYIVKDFFDKAVGIRPDGTLGTSTEKKVFLYRRDAHPCRGVLISADFPKKFLISGFDRQSNTYIFDVLQDNGSVTLKNCTTNTFACSISDPINKIEVNRKNANNWERFSLEKADFQLGHDVQASLDLLLEIAEKSSDPDFLLQAICNKSQDILKPVFEDLIIHSNMNTLSALTDRMVESRFLSEKIMALLPQDLWSTYGIPQALSFRRALSDNNETESCGPEFDQLGTVEMMERLSRFTASATFLVNATLRRSALPKRNSCIVATVRNEGVYLPEWIAYHKALGFDHIYIYSNNNDDESDALLDILSSHGIITHIKNTIASQVRPQIKSYCHALSIIPDILDFRWCAFIDVDEFIGYDRGRFASFPDYLAWMDIQDVDAIALSWVMFTPSEIRRFQDAGLLKSFTYRQPDTDVHVKSIIRPSAFFASGPHSPNTIWGHHLYYAISTGERHAQEFASAANYREAPSEENAWIAHYHLKSSQDFLWKMSRGTGMDFSGTNFGINIRSDFIPHFVHAFGNEDKIEDLRMRSLAGATFNSNLQYLFNIKGVRETYARCLNHYNEKTVAIEARLRERPDDGLLNALAERC